jgi:hypothetical protein
MANLRITGQPLIREGKIKLLLQTGLEKEADLTPKFPV